MTSNYRYGPGTVVGVVVVGVVEVVGDSVVVGAISMEVVVLVSGMVVVTGEVVVVEPPRKRFDHAFI
jgi:cytoskeletal protein CcmA (bactofilin family)